MAEMRRSEQIRFRYQGHRTEKNGQLIDLHRYCDCCSFTKTDHWYLCLDCDFGLCDTCFANSQDHNPGHRIGRVLAHPPPASSDIGGADAWELINNPDYVPRLDNAPCCATCFNYTPEFVKSDWHESDGGMWYSSRQPLLSDLRDSALGGCEICSIIFRAVSKAIPHLLTSRTSLHFSIYMRMLVVYVSEPRLDQSVSLILRGISGCESRWSIFEPAEVWSRNLGDQKCFERARNWLKECETSHNQPSCRQKAESALPRRVIEIQQSVANPSLRLLETNDGAVGKYISLSHCWGGYKGCVTTGANLSERCTRIDYGSLPQTFKDAVDCAVELNVPYLWIDSLCIIQDDPKDWAQESAKMAEVYSNAYLVVAAASSPADEGGFLLEPEERYRGIALESREGSGQDDLVIHAAIPHSGSLDHPASMSPVCLGPLGGRAWTLQETLLARRCIGFNSYEIAWECHSTVDCECGSALETSKQSSESAGGPVNWVYGTSLGGLSSGGRTRREHPRPLTQLRDITTTFMEWHSILVPNYTRKKLTFSDDRLPAISAIAKIVAEATGSEYIAGLWRDNISISLSWRVEEEHKPKLGQPLLSSAATLNAPSFSWASVDKSIVYDLPYLVGRDGSSPYGSIGVKVVDFDVPLSSENQFGAVQGGWIKLSGLSHSLELRWNPTDRKYEISGKTPHRLHHWLFQADTALQNVIVEDSNGRHTVSAERATSKPDMEQFRASSVQGLLILDVPRVGYSTNGPESVYFEPHDVAMMVLGVSSSNPRQFQRLGLATVEIEPDIALEWISSAKKEDFIII